MLVLAALLPLTGCLFRSHQVDRRISTAVLMEATKADLVTRLQSHANAIQTLNATVNISPVVGGAKKGKITEYTDISGYILARKPAMLRMIGLFPIVRNRAFDMVSDGSNFKVSLPTRNKFIVGKNAVSYPTDKPMEDMRPQHIFDALLLQPPAADEIAVLEAGTETVIEVNTRIPVDEPDYILSILRKTGDDWSVARKIIFGRENLQPTRELIYDNAGNIATDARYDKYTEYNGVLFPAKIQVTRPQEEYSIVLDVVKLKFNEPLTDEQFQLVQPPGTQVLRLDLPPSERGMAADGSNQGSPQAHRR